MMARNSPPGRHNEIRNATNSPPTRGLFPGFWLSGGAFCGPAQRNGATPITARDSGRGKVYILSLIGSCALPAGYMLVYSLRTTRQAICKFIDSLLLAI